MRQLRAVRLLASPGTAAEFAWPPILAQSASAKARPTRPRAATAARIFCQSRHGRNSSASRRRPPARCAASRTTIPHSPALTSGCSVHAGSLRARPHLKRLPERPEMQRQEEPRARAPRGGGPGTPSRRGDSGRGSRSSSAEHAETARSPSTARASAKGARQDRRDAPAPAEPLGRDRAQPDRRMHRDREHEHGIEGEPARRCRACGRGSRRRSGRRAPRR